MSMNPEVTAAIFGAIIGALLSGLVGWWLSVQSEKRDSKNKYRFILRIILVDIDRAIDFYTKAKTEIGAPSYKKDFSHEMREFGGVYKNNATYITYDEAHNDIVKKIVNFYATCPKIIYKLENAHGDVPQKANEAINDAEFLRGQINEILGIK